MFYSLSLEVTRLKKFGSRDGLAPDYDMFAPDAQANLTETEFPSFTPKFCALILTKLSIEADFINNWGAIGGTGYIVSKKAKDLLSGFRMPPHRFYPLTYWHHYRRNEKEKNIIEGQYFWMQILIEDLYDWLDYERSEFQKINVFTDEFSIIKPRNSKELKKAFEDIESPDTRIGAVKLTLNEAYKKNGYDLFFLNDLSWYPYITQQLKDALEEAKVTGLEPFEAREGVSEK